MTKRETPPRVVHYNGGTSKKDKAKANKALRPFLEMIGRVASAWSNLEQVVDDAVWTLAEVSHDKGACLTAQIQSFEYRMRALIALVELRGGSPELISSLNRLTREANSLTTARNRIIHDPVSFLTPANIVITSRIVANRKLDMQFFPVSLDDYKKTNDGIGVMRTNFIGLRDKIYAELQP